MMDTQGYTRIWARTVTHQVKAKIKQNRKCKKSTYIFPPRQAFSTPIIIPARLSICF